MPDSISNNDRQIKTTSRDKMPWMAWYPVDYRRDTAHLNRAQDGSYRRLIDEYWIKGGLPTDERQLAQIAGMTLKEWKNEREIYAEFFGPNWTHKRIDAELAKASSISKKRRDAVGKRRDRVAIGNVIDFPGGAK